LVQRYGTLDGVLKAGLFQTQAEMLRLYRLIATMDAKAPLPLLADQEPTWGSASTLTRDWGLNQLADRLGGDGLTLWSGMSRKAVRGHSLHGPEQQGCDWINRQRTGAYAAGQIWRLS
jgi:hypothetical protein